MHVQSYCFGHNTSCFLTLWSISVKTQPESLKAIFYLMDDVILSCYNYGSLADEHNMYQIKKLLLQNNKQTIKDEEF